MEFFFHIIGICPDSHSHFDLVNLYFSYIENKLDLKKTIEYLNIRISSCLKN